MTAVLPPLPWLNITRKWKRGGLTQRSRRKVSAVAAADMIADVSKQSSEDSLDGAGFCGESFADNGELLSSLSPLLFSMKLFGLYFERPDRHRRRTDDPESNHPATTTARTSSTCLRIYATVVLIFVWLNAARYAWVFKSSERFGPPLFTKIAVFIWSGLAAIFQTAYYFASHTGQLVEVLLTFPVTQECIKKARRFTVGVTAFTWMTLVENAAISVYLFIFTDGQYDFALAPFVTYIEVPGGKIILARCVGILVYFWAIPCCVLSQMITLVLVYIFYHQFRKLEKNFHQALGERGQFHGDFSLFRRRHCICTKMF